MDTSLRFLSILLALSVLIFATLWFRADSKRAYEQCVVDGKQSNTTCAAYTGFRPHNVEEGIGDGK